MLPDGEGPSVVRVGETGAVSAEGTSRSEYAVLIVASSSWVDASLDWRGVEGASDLGVGSTMAVKSYVCILTVCVIGCGAALPRLSCM